LDRRTRILTTQCGEFAERAAIGHGLMTIGRFPSGAKVWLANRQRRLQNGNVPHTSLSPRFIGPSTIPLAKVVVGLDSTRVFASPCITGDNAPAHLALCRTHLYPRYAGRLDSTLSDGMILRCRSTRLLTTRCSEFFARTAGDHSWDDHRQVS
jgi:hypothetical protein